MTIKRLAKKPTQTLVVVIAITRLAVPPATGAQPGEFFMDRLAR